jgi:hypothetical protein
VLVFGLDGQISGGYRTSDSVSGYSSLLKNFGKAGSIKAATANLCHSGTVILTEETRRIFDGAKVLFPSANGSSSGAAAPSALEKFLGIWTGDGYRQSSFAHKLWEAA